MKKIILILFLIPAMICSAQVNFLPMPDNFCNSSFPSQAFTMTSATNSTNGWVHTPKGNLHILVIFIKDNNNVPPVDWGGDSLSPGYWGPDTIPNWTMGDSNQLLDETPATIGNYIRNPILRKSTINDKISERICKFVS